MINWTAVHFQSLLVKIKWNFLHSLPIHNISRWAIFLGMEIWAGPRSFRPKYEQDPDFGGKIWADLRFWGHLRSIFMNILILGINLWHSFQKSTEFIALQLKFLKFWVYFFCHEPRLLGLILVSRVVSPHHIDIYVLHPSPTHTLLQKWQ